MPLSDLQRDKFEDMLRTLTVERQEICNAMVFVMDNAESGARCIAARVSTIWACFPLLS
jgi:hypothetical protein